MSRWDAIVREPAAFLMDEPPPTSTRSCGADARRDRRSPALLETTTIYVTHDQVEAMTMGDRVAVMQGQLQQVADPQTLYDHPSTSSSEDSSARPP